MCNRTTIPQTCSVPFSVDVLMLALDVKNDPAEAVFLFDSRGYYTSLYRGVPSWIQRGLKSKFHVEKV